MFSSWYLWWQRTWYKLAAWWPLAKISLMQLLLSALVALAVFAGLAIGGPRPCDSQAAAMQAGEPGGGPAIVAASEVPAGNLVIVSGAGGRVGIVVERGGPSGSFDQAPAVRVLMLDDGLVATLAHSEAVVNLGKLAVVPRPAYRVELKGGE